MKSFLKKINFNFIVVHFMSLLASVLSVTAIIFIFGGRINSFLFVIEYFVSCLITYSLFKNKISREDIIFNFIFNGLLFYLLCNISLLFYDFSWDGNVYHKQMIGLMKNGVNPLFNKNCGDIWSQHYANGSEVWGAVLYSFFGDIEVGKVINLILSLCLFIYSYKTILKISKSKLFSILFSFAISFNPILINQFHSYYIDGIVSNSLFIFILSIINFIIDDFSANDKVNIFIFVTSSIVAINSKFTALLIWGLFLAVLGCYVLFINLKNRKFDEIKKLILIAFCTGVFSVVVVGSSSYMKNLVKYHNPFYPLMGSGAVDIETGNEPEKFKNFNHVQKWLYGTFSETYTWYDKDPKLKIPFTVSQSELYSIEFPDIRIGGLGVWYSGLLCISLPIILIGIFMNIRKNKVLNIVCILLLCAVILPIPILPIVWQARYYPQLYLIPFIASLYAFSFDKRVFKLYGYIIVICACVNGLFMVPQAKDKYNRSKDVNNQLTELAEKSLTDKIIISQDNYTFYGTYYNYIDKNIKYEYSKTRLKDGVSFYYGAMYKIVDSEGEK